jgi:hypothetical protein
MIPDDSITKITRDPKFLKLAPGAQAMVLSQIDPHFKAMAPEEQQKAVSYLTNPPGWKTRVARAAPSTVGSIIGGTVGAAAGPPGEILGAGIGGAVGELPMIAWDKIRGNPEGEAPVGTRLWDAAKGGMTGQAIGIPVGRLAGMAASGLTSAATQTAERLATAGIPQGIAEVSESPVVKSAMRMAARAPGGKLVVGQAARAQSEAVAQQGAKILDDLGGPRESAKFVRDAAANFQELKTALVKAGKLRAMGNIDAAKEVLSQSGFEGDLFNNMGDIATTSKLYAAHDAISSELGKTVKEAKVAQMLAKNPSGLALLMQKSGQEGLGQLRQSWLTSVLSSAMDKETGVLNPNKLTDAWDSLQSTGQERLFGAYQPAVSQFMDKARTAGVSKLAAAANQGGLMEALKSGAGLGTEAIMGSLALAHGFSPTEVLSTAAVPWAVAKALTTPELAETFASTLGSPEALQAAGAVPAVVKGGVQAVRGLSNAESPR